MIFFCHILMGKPILAENFHFFRITDHILNLFFEVVRLVQLRDVEDEWHEKFTTTNGGTSVEIISTPGALQPSAWTVTRQTINCSTFFPDIR